MATKKGKEAYDFVVAALKRNKDIEFAKVRDSAAKKGIKLYPIVYGRAKAALGLVPVSKYGEGKAARATKKAAKKAAAKKVGRPAGKKTARRAVAADSGGLELMASALESMQSIQRERDVAVDTLRQIRDLIDRALDS